MVNIAVLGSDEFIVGFQLAGVKDTIQAGSEPFKDIQEIKKRKDIGIVVLDEKIAKSLDSNQKQDVENSVEPVFITLSANLEQESLKKLIKKSIGIDLW